MTVIQPVGLDHQEFLGDDLAGDRGGEGRHHQERRAAGGGTAESRSPRDVILRRADRLGVPAVRVRPGFCQPVRNMAAWSMRTRAGLLDLPLPGWSAATRSRMPASPSPPCAMPAARLGRRTRRSRTGLATVEWPARLQRLHKGPLVEVRAQGRRGLAGRRPQSAWRRSGVARHGRHGRAWRAAALSDLRHAGEQGRAGLSARLQWPGAACGDGGDPRRGRAVWAPARFTMPRAGRVWMRAPAEDLEDAMLQVTAWSRLDAQDMPPRILICGSLYLAGKVLAENS